MIGVVVVTHGQLATELVNAAEMIVGDLPQFTTVTFNYFDAIPRGAGGKFEDFLCLIPDD